ncbi:MAG: ATP-dependent helicase [Fusobacteriota bacterium]
MDINFRKDQKKIMEYEKGRMAVPSVPGAGKTFILTNLTVKLIKENLEENRKILILTYMNSGVVNFKHRINSLLKKQGISDQKRYQVMTIHSFASKVIKDYIHRLNLSSNYNVINDNLKSQYISDSIKEVRREKEALFLSYLEKKGAHRNWQNNLSYIFKSILSHFKSNSISVEDAKKMQKKISKNGILTLCIDIFEKYQAKLERLALIDFDDILFYAYKILKENSDVKKDYQEKYKYILEDEAQDSTQIQNKILNLIGKNWVKVGDFNQSIMSTFTASDPIIFENFIKKAETKKEMFTAGRSSKDIINLANSYVKWVTNSFPQSECQDALLPQYIKEVPPGEEPQNPKVSGYGIRYYKKDNKEDMTEWISKLVKSYSKKYDQKSIGVLFPARYLIDDCIEEFEKQDIDYQILTGISSENAEFFNKLSDIIKFLDKPYSPFFFKNTIENEFEDNDAKQELVKIDEFWKKMGLTYKIEDIIFNLNDIKIPREIMNLDIWPKYMDFLNKLKKLLEFPKMSLEKLVMYIGEIFDVSNDQKIILDGIADELNSYYRINPKWGLKDLANELDNAQNNKFSLVAKFLYNMKEDVDQKKVIITTYHGSKGLEWDFVILGGLDKYNFPGNVKDNFRGEAHYLKEKYANPAILAKYELEKYIKGESRKDPFFEAKINEISERIRLVYVGITRARENLALIMEDSRNFPSIYFSKLSSIIDDNLNN